MLWDISQHRNIYTEIYRNRKRVKISGYIGSNIGIISRHTAGVKNVTLSKLKKATDRYEIQAKGTQEEITNLFLLRQKCSENLLHTSKTM